MIRIGQSNDIHKLVEGRDLILGGVNVPHEKGLLGHSDADALMHTIAEAILGALALGDLGHHFPDTDPRWKDVSSSRILKECIEIMKVQGYRIGNIDSIIMIERPKLARYIYMMVENIAEICEVGVEDVSVKATKGEGIGFIGRTEGIMASAIVLLIKVED